MRGLLLLALLVPLVSGCGGHARSSSRTGTTPNVSRWVEAERLPQEAIRGAALFESSDCIACHTYAGSGRQVLGAPDLTAIGSRHLGIRFQIKHLECPSCVIPGSPMPPFKTLGETRLRELAIFLEASKGRR